ncbi:MAG: RloB domain-containing protein [Actinobacteria bacterium]|nr:RloB domain-containing protein [Actinomycetota bacterium]
MARRENTQRRRRPFRPPRPRILVVCGGARTEPQYIKGLRDHLRNPAVDVTIGTDGRDPAQIVRRATRADGDYEQVWCVVDVDQFDLADAVKEARSHSINLAVSNPCFELWLLLHHADCNSHQANADAVTKLLQRHVPHYDKTRLVFAHFVAGVMFAVDRARKLQPDPETHTWNPSTSVWRLVEAIQGSSGREPQ